MSGYYVYSGQTSTGIILNWNDSMYIYFRGRANGTKVNTGGGMYVCSGGTADGITADTNAYLYVFSGGTATNIVTKKGAFFGLAVASGTYIQGTVNQAAFEMKNAFISGYTIDSSCFMTVERGGVAKDIVVDTGGSMYVSGSGAADGITVNPAGSMFISSGGSAMDIVENGGYVYVAGKAKVSFVPNTFTDLVLSGKSATVHSGTTANSTAISSGGLLQISSGGNASRTAVNSAGSMHVFRGGMADSTTIGRSGVLEVFDAGTVNKSFIEAGGRLRISSGGTATGTTVYSAGRLSVSGGGELNETVINSGGTLTIFDGVKANSTKVNGGGWLYIENGGLATNVVENGGYVGIGEDAEVNFVPHKFTGVSLSSGTATVHSGTTATETDVRADSWLLVYCGGSAENSVINSAGYLCISGGGTADGIVVNCGGSIFVSGGGAAMNIVENGGCVNVSEGAEVSFSSHTFSGLIIAKRFQEATLHSGTTANNAVITNGLMTVYDGGKANDASVKISGFLIVSSGGSVDNITVGSGGTLRVFSGGTVTDVRAENMATVELTVASDTFIRGTYEGSAFEMKDALISGYTVHSRGWIDVGNGGRTDHICVNQGADMFVSSGGIADNTIVNYGNLTVFDGGTVNSVELNGYLYVSSGGKITGMLSASAAVVSAYEGSIVDFDLSGLTAEAPARISDLSLIKGDPSYTVTVTADQADGTYTLAEGAAGFDQTVTVYCDDVKLGSLAVGETVTLAGQDYTLNLADTLLTLTVGSVVPPPSGAVKTYNGGVFVSAADTMMDKVLVNGGAEDTMEVYSGGIAGNTTVNSGGYLYVYNGGTATNIVENGGYVDIEYGANVTFTPNTINGLMLSDWQSATLHSGTMANDTTMDRGELYVYSGAAVNGATINEGSLVVYSGGAANSVIVNSDSFLQVDSTGTADGIIVNDGRLYVQRKGSVCDTTVNSAGSMRVRSAGSANRTTVNSGGCLYVYEKGSANSTTVNSMGYLYVSDRGRVNSTIINSKGYLYVSSGGIANSTIINSKGHLFVESGGTDSNTHIDYGGYLYVYGGGSAAGTTVASNGYLTVDGGTAADIVISSGGNLRIAYGDSCTGKVTGSLQVESGAVISAYEGSIIDFDISGLTSGAARINDLSLIQGAPTYTVTVSDTQTEGIYILADGAAGFDQTVTVYSDDVELGSLAVGETVTLAGQDYTLNLADTLLTLTVGSVVPPPSGAVKTYNGGVFVSAADAMMDEVLVNGGEADTMHVSSGGLAYSTIVDDGGSLHVSEGGVVIETTVRNRGNMTVSSGGSANTLTMTDNALVLIKSGGKIGCGVTLTETGYFAVEAGAIFDFTVRKQTDPDTPLLNDWSLIQAGMDASEYTPSGYILNYNGGNIADYTATVSTSSDHFTEDGIYKLAGNANGFNTSITVKTPKSILGTLTVGGFFVYEDRSYSLIREDGILSLKIAQAAPMESDLRVNFLENGVSQVLAWDSAQGKVGFMATNGNPSPSWRGVWEWSTEYNSGLGASEAELWKVVGAGHFSGSEVDYDGILLYNGIGNTFAAWTDLNDPSYGYVSLCHVDGNFQTKCLADFDGNGFDDVIIFNELGSVGIVSDAAAYHDVWHVDPGTVNPWELLGAGTFDTSLGQDSILFRNTANNHLYLWDNQGSDIGTWNWRQTNIGWLADGWEFAAIGDFAGDGIDDIVLVNRSDNDAVFVWDNGDRSTQHYVGILGEGFKIETVGDYDGDGKEDLLLREYKSGWGGIGCWSGADATAWTDFNARIETDMESKFAIIA